MLSMKLQRNDGGVEAYRVTGCGAKIGGGIGNGVDRVRLVGMEQRAVVGLE